MSATGSAGFVGYPPKAVITERMLITDVPEEERAMFLAFAKAIASKNRAGVEVFPKETYKTWKKTV
tara:strand:+ start:972 stop:1169 length:198 start_codon:yes stop_codon:yes gene_type:complete